MAIIIIVPRPRGSSGIAIPAEYIKASQFDLTAGFRLSVPDSKSLTLLGGAAKTVWVQAAQTVAAKSDLGRTRQFNVGTPLSQSIRVSGNLVPARMSSPATLRVYQSIGHAQNTAVLNVVDRQDVKPVYHKYIGGKYAGDF